MADDHPAGEPGVPVLDLAFDPGMLDALRAGERLTPVRQACPKPEPRTWSWLFTSWPRTAWSWRRRRTAAYRKLAGALHGQVEDGEPLASGIRLSCQIT